MDTNGGRVIRGKVIRVAISVLLLAACAAAAQREVLIVADEMPQMESLAKMLKARANTDAKLVKQDALPADLQRIRTIVVFIHGVLQETVEKELVDYARAGGRLLLLHHSISQGKGKNRYWFPMLGIKLTPGDPYQGYYKYVYPTTFTVVNLAPGNYITSHNVKYDIKALYRRSDTDAPEQEYPAFVLRDSEILLNHVFTDNEAKTVLMGFKWTDEKTGKTWMQDRAGWYKHAGKGWIIYLQPGHSMSDFESPAYSQIVLNAFETDLK